MSSAFLMEMPFVSGAVHRFQHTLDKNKNTKDVVVPGRFMFPSSELWTVGREGVVFHVPEILDNLETGRFIPREIVHIANILSTPGFLQYQFSHHRPDAGALVTCMASQSSAASSASAAAPTSPPTDLLTHQTALVSWLGSVEDCVRSHQLVPVSESVAFRAADGTTAFCVDLESGCATKTLDSDSNLFLATSGAIVADENGLRTKEALMRMALDRPVTLARSSSQVFSRSKRIDATQTTLFVVPQLSLGCWVSAVDPALLDEGVVVVIRSATDHKRVTAGALCAARVVLVTTEYLEGSRYMRLWVTPSNSSVVVSGADSTAKDRAEVHLMAQHLAAVRAKIQKRKRPKKKSKGRTGSSSSRPFSATRSHENRVLQKPAFGQKKDGGSATATAAAADPIMSLLSPPLRHLMWGRVLLHDTFASKRRRVSQLSAVVKHCVTSSTVIPMSAMATMTDFLDVVIRRRKRWSFSRLCDLLRTSDNRQVASLLAYQFMSSFLCKRSCEQVDRDAAASRKISHSVVPIVMMSRERDAIAHGSTTSAFVQCANLPTGTSNGDEDDDDDDDDDDMSGMHAVSLSDMTTHCPTCAQTPVIEDTVSLVQKTKCCALCMSVVPRCMGAMVLPCGHGTCSPCGTKWLAKSGKCPMCRQPSSADRSALVFADEKGLERMKRRFRMGSKSFILRQLLQKVLLTPRACPPSVIVVAMFPAELERALDLGSSPQVRTFVVKGRQGRRTKMIAEAKAFPGSSVLLVEEWHTDMDLATEFVDFVVFASPVDRASGKVVINSARPVGNVRSLQVYHMFLTDSQEESLLSREWPDQFKLVALREEALRQQELAELQGVV